MMHKNSLDPYLPAAVEVVGCSRNAKTIFTLHLRFLDTELQKKYHFHPGQFNMLYLHGVGEVAISIVSDPDEKDVISHTIRAIGRVTRALEKLKPGDCIGLRGPFGRGWPLHKKSKQQKDVIVITGGLGCAPSVSIINYILARRKHYGDLKILQGVKHSEDFIFQKQYKQWEQSPNTKVYVSADSAGIDWKLRVGHVTDMLETIELNPDNTIAMMCGPEMMMHAAINALCKRGVAEDNMYLSMERNMKCGVGHCGHCQYGGLFICKDGPVFSYPEVKALFDEPGF